MIHPVNLLIRFKKLSDYSDDDCCASLKHYEPIEDTESDHDWPSKAQVPDFRLANNKPDVHAEAEIISHGDEQNALPIQSNSSVNISKNLKEGK